MKTGKNWWALNQPMHELKGKNMPVPGNNDKKGYFHDRKTDLQRT
jgi:hypothetical protein